MRKFGHAFRPTFFNLQEIKPLLTQDRNCYTSYIQEIIRPIRLLVLTTYIDIDIESTVKVERGRPLNGIRKLLKPNWQSFHKHMYRKEAA